MSEYKKIENAKAELVCTLEGDDWKKAIESSFKKLAAKVEVKGFRKGQAPKNLVEKYVDTKYNYLFNYCNSLEKEKKELINNWLQENEFEKLF